MKALISFHPFSQKYIIKDDRNSVLPVTSNQTEQVLVKQPEIEKKTIDDDLTPPRDAI